MARWILASLSYLALLGAWAIPATATPVDVFFTGPSSSGTSYGLSTADAVDARDNFGVQWVTPSELVSVGFDYGIVQSAVLDFRPNPPISATENTGRQEWTVENTSGGSFDGTSYLLFTNSNAYTASATLIDYLDENVGLPIDEALGWVIVAAPAGDLGTFYYPAIELNGITANGAVSDLFDVNYVVKEALIQAPVGSGSFHLPQLVVYRGFTPIPEPGTAALLAAGFALLGIRRHLRF